MVQLRDGVDTHSTSITPEEPKSTASIPKKVGHSDANETTDENKENHAPSVERKRDSQGVKRKTSDNSDVTGVGKARPTTPEPTNVIRDNRPTPGRMVPPRGFPPNAFRKETDAPELRSPAPEPPQKKKRMTAIEKEQEFQRKSLNDPNEYFHDLHICFEKGPNGSPTYDEAGFQLDYDKVARWMKPDGRSKKGKLKAVDKMLDYRAQENEKMKRIFFGDRKVCETNVNFPEKFWRDKVSKDLDLPWHKVDSAAFEEWDRRGFEKQNPEDWKEFTDAEQKRMFRMAGGSQLRK